MYLRYSSMVVAPMSCISPRASAGFKMFAASMAPPSPPVPPAPTRVWISSTIKMMFFLESSTSLMTFLSRSSNSPRYFVPASREARSSCTRRFPSSKSGTSLAAMRCARPSAIAVLPTPGSPMSTGLFFWRRAKIWIARSISSSRPMSLSFSPAATAAVRSLPNSASADSYCLPSPSAPPLPLALEPPEAPEPSSSFLSTEATSWSCLVISSGTPFTSTFSFSNTFRMLPSFSFMIDSRMCAGSTTSLLSILASLMPPARKRLAAGVKGISFGTRPSPLPMHSSTALRTSLALTPSLRRTLPETPVFSAMTPTSSISVLTKLWPKRRLSSCALHTALSARSLNFSNIIDMEPRPDLAGAAAEVTEPAIEDPRKEEPLEATQDVDAMAMPAGAPTNARPAIPDFLLLLF
mmetsp:Transcript_98129/g.259178  ORF Transcript_98129/g.259178 Transcript_98129/m.259178 type:complete len:408 (-) Transcript_98129:442-1665(-)